MTVHASDQGRGIPNQATASLQVTVEDVNDNRPIFCVLGSSSCPALVRGDEYVDITLPLNCSESCGRNCQ